MKTRLAVLLSLSILTLASATLAQGPPPGTPAGPVGDLEADLDALSERVDVLEAGHQKLAGIVGNLSAVVKLLESELNQPDRSVPTGTVMPFAGPVAEIPDGWLLCDGSELDRSAYPELFAVIGTAHGHGDGVATFDLPDYRGMFLRGVDFGRGLDPDRGGRSNLPGGSTGDRVGSQQGHMYARHSHSLGPHGLCDDGAHNGGLFPILNAIHGCFARTTTHLNGGNESRPVNVYVHFIIKD